MRVGVIYDFKFGTFIARFPSDGVGSVAVNGLTVTWWTSCCCKLIEEKKREKKKREKKER